MLSIYGRLWSLKGCFERLPTVPVIKAAGLWDLGRPNSGIKIKVPRSYNFSNVPGRGRRLHQQ